jgi:hypothetical protein
MRRLHRYASKGFGRFSSTTSGRGEDSDRNSAVNLLWIARRLSAGTRLCGEIAFRGKAGRQRTVSVSRSDVILLFLPDQPYRNRAPTRIGICPGVIAERIKMGKVVAD